MNIKTIYTSAIVFLALLFAACDMADSGDRRGSGEKAAVQVIPVASSVQSRTVAPSVELEETDWRLSGGTSGDTETLLAKFSDEDRTVYLTPGTWDFTLEGYKDGVLILIGTIAKQTISLGSQNILKFIVAPVLAGEGTVSIAIELPANSGITEAWIFQNGAKLTASITPVDNRIVLEYASYPAGDYYFSVRLYKDADLYGVVSEVVQVRAHLESAKTYTLTMEDLNRVYVITYHLWDGKTQFGYFRHTDDAVTLLTDVSRSGYAFQGWYNTASFYGEPVTTIPAGSMEDRDFYAKWVAQYTVTFNAQGGSVSPSTITVDAGGNVTALPTATRSGYTFNGWFTQPNGGGSQFTTNTSVNGNITVYAAWTSTSNTVTFDAQGGSVSPSTITVTAGGNVTALPTATRKGYTFNGWFTQPNSGGSQFTTGTPVNGNITVYAAWTATGAELTEEGVYIGIISFALDATDLTNGSPILLDYWGKDSLISKINNDYDISTQAGTSLFYGVHKALANLESITTSPDRLDSVNVITFTDGLDNASSGNSAFNPIEGQVFNTENDYATYVDGQIDSRTIGGKPITAYSVGVLGADVVDSARFQSNLEKIASDGKDYVLTDFEQVQATFTAIADSLQVEVVHSNTNFNMKTPLFPPGTKVRMTFDVSGTDPSDAAGSSKYIEGTISRTGLGANLVYTFGDITYGGGLGSTQGAGPITGTIDDSSSEVNFAFTGMTGYDPATDESLAKQWYCPPSATEWQMNSEYSISGSTNVQVEKRSALIYLVLDASRSLNTTQIGQIREAANGFINLLYDRLNQ
jgi:uncharacterized repeat protein (TIGR02543 family)